MNLSERDSNVIWHPFTQAGIEPLPIGIVRGEDSLLYDENENEYIDAISSWWVNIHGHAHPYIAEKVAQQLRTLEHVIFAGFTHPPAVELAERLLQILPSNLSRIFYSDNGSTAVEVGLKMALQYFHNTGNPRTGIIALRDSYHGDTFGAMSVGERGSFNIPFEPLLFDVKFIDAPIRGAEQQSISQLEALLAEGNIAAFIFEPLVQGSGGMKMHEAEGLARLIRLCRDHGVLTIADEVMTGFGRTGKLFATDHLQEKADIVCLSKGLTGGTMPLGITACTPEIFEAFRSQDKHKAFYHGHSFTANPLSCTAALASLDLLLDPGTMENIERIAKKHASFITANSSHPLIKNIRQQGTILAFEIETSGKEGYFNSISSFLKKAFLERNIILRPLGNTLYVMPPYCTTNEQLDRVYSVIREVLDLLSA